MKTKMDLKTTKEKIDMELANMLDDLEQELIRFNIKMERLSCVTDEHIQVTAQESEEVKLCEY
jgi:hypothetical protein|tara:strand:- start:188 stop:376 length:189 start_codon:yes stop_codon:yes gene_type:complete